MKNEKNGKHTNYLFYSFSVFLWIYLCLLVYLTVAETIAPDFESNCVSEEKAEFSLVAEEGFEPPTFGL